MGKRHPNRRKKMKIDNVIIATDMSETAAAAAKWGMSFAKTLGVDVVLAHVIEVSLGGWLKGTFEIMEDENKLNFAKEKLKKWCVDATGSAPDAIEIRAGGTLHQLKAIATEWEGHSVIVVAQSGASAIEKLLLGSTAQRLASQPPCPLIIVHPEHTEFTVPATLVCGTDFSPNANLALDFAVEICEKTKSKIIVTHGHKTPVLGSIFDAGAEAVIALQQSIEEMEAVKMDALGKGLKEKGIETKTLIVEEDPSTLIIATARSEKADLVIVGHGGESPLVQNILGSVAQKVLGKMPTTFVIVPQSDI